MGNKIHIQTKHVIVYGDSGFNWQWENLKELLETYGCLDLYEAQNDNSIEWKIPEEQFHDAIEEIAKENAKEIRNFFNKSFLENYTDEEFKDYVVSKLKTFEETGDHKSGFYHFSWF